MDSVTTDQSQHRPLESENKVSGGRDPWLISQTGDDGDNDDNDDDDGADNDSDEDKSTY